MRNLITCLVVCVLSGATFADTWTVDDDGKADFDNIDIQKQTNVTRNGNLLAYDLVVGETGSRSVVAVDLDTMTTETIWSSLQSTPRGIAMTEDGDIFLAMNTPETHIVKLDWTGTNWEYEDFSGPIGSWGPGKLGVDDQERLIVTGDNTHYVYIYDPNTGDLLDSFTHSGTGNIVGLRVVDSKAYVLEIFGDRVWVGDLVSNPIQTEVVLQDSNLDYSHGLALDNDGRLYIANYNAYKIEVYDISSGDWIESWTTPDRPTDIYFSSPHQLFVVSSGNGLFVMNQEGVVIEKFDITARSINRWTLTYIDSDADGIPDKKDNCYLYNPDQADCNENEIGDICDIAEETSADVNSNEVPDECECLSDVNNDGIVNVNDALLVIGNWNGSGPIGDVNFDGTVNVSDLLSVIDSWGPCE